MSELTEELCLNASHDHGIHCSGCAGSTVSHVCGRLPCAYYIPEPAPQGETPAQLKRRCDTCHLESGAFKSTSTGFQWLPIGSRCAWTSCEGHVEETPPDRSVSITSDRAKDAADKIVESLRNGFTNITATKERVAAIIQSELGAPDGVEARLTDEVSRRMDAVVDAAVEWRQGDETNWQDKAEALENAIDALLELRG